MLEVNGSVLKFKDGVSADYEQDQVLHFKLKATDLDGLTYEQEFNLNITNDTSDDQNDIVETGSLQISVIINSGFDSVMDQNFIELGGSGDIFNDYD